MKCSNKVSLWNAFKYNGWIGLKFFLELRNYGVAVVLFLRVNFYDLRVVFKLSKYNCVTSCLNSAGFLFLNILIKGRVPCTNNYIYR